MENEGYTTWQSEFLTHGWNAEVIVTTFIQFFEYNLEDIPLNLGDLTT